MKEMSDEGYRVFIEDEQVSALRPIETHLGANQKEGLATYYRCRD
jgi:hypothetical protein